MATIFLPMVLVAGIYGMNFENMPELKWSWAYFAVLGFMGVIMVGAVCWFWSRKWIGWGRQQVSRVRPFAVDPNKLLGYIEQVAGWHPRQR